MKSHTAWPVHNSSISQKGLPVCRHRAWTSSSHGWHSAGLEPSNILILSNCLSNLTFWVSSTCASTPIWIVLCRASANWDVVFCKASMIAVVFEWSWFTTFIIKVIAADKSDAGAEGAADTLDGAMGDGGNVIGKYAGGANWFCKGGVLYWLWDILGLTCGVARGTWLVVVCPCCIGKLLTTSVGGVPPVVDKLFVVYWEGNTFVLFLPVPTIPGCNVHFELFEAVCNPVFIEHAAGSCPPPQWMHLFLILENWWSTVCLCLSTWRSVPIVLLWAVIWEVAFLSALDTERWHGTVTFKVSRLLTSPTDDVRFVCWQALGLFLCPVHFYFWS